MTQNELISQFNALLCEDDIPQPNAEHEVLFMLLEDDKATISKVIQKLIQLKQDFELEYCDDGYVEIQVKHLA